MSAMVRVHVIQTLEDANALTSGTCPTVQRRSVLQILRQAKSVEGRAGVTPRQVCASATVIQPKDLSILWTTIHGMQSQGHDGTTMARLR